jgi:hypothetical protein
MLLVVIAAMGTALVAQEQRHRQREAELAARHEAELAARLERQTRQFIKVLNEKEVELLEERRCSGYRCRLE